MNKFVFIYGGLAIGLQAAAIACFWFFVQSTSAAGQGLLLAGGIILNYFTLGFFGITVLYALPPKRQPALLLQKNVRTGNLPILTIIVFGGYLFSAFAWWWCRHSRLVRSIDAAVKKRTLENTHDQILPRVHLGRRCAFHELPRGTTIVVDLTAEFFAIPGAVDRLQYACLPTLDTMVPDMQAFNRLVDQVESYHNEREDGVIYVHCANGHGRSAALVAALLLRMEMANSVAEAQAFLQRFRPTVKLHGMQRVFLEDWYARQIRGANNR